MKYINFKFNLIIKDVYNIDIETGEFKEKIELNEIKI